MSDVHAIKEEIAALRIVALSAIKLIKGGSLVKDIPVLVAAVEKYDALKVAVADAGQVAAELKALDSLGVGDVAVQIGGVVADVRAQLAGTDVAL